MGNKITGGRKERGKENGFIDAALLPGNKANSSINNSVSPERAYWRFVPTERLCFLPYQVRPALWPDLLGSSFLSSNATASGSPQHSSQFLPSKSSDSSDSGVRQTKVDVQLSSDSWDLGWVSGPLWASVSPSTKWESECSPFLWGVQESHALLHAKAKEVRNSHQQKLWLEYILSLLSLYAACQLVASRKIGSLFDTS